MSKRPFAHPLYGSDFKNLVQLKKKYGAAASSYRLQWYTALALAAIRSPFTVYEKFYVSRKIKNIDKIKSPVFIIGHWRTGTTHLGNILSKSPQFGYVSPLATGIPWNFLTLGRWFRPLLEKTLPSNRLIDNVAVKPDSPQEDAFGIANMQTISFAHGLYFPKAFELSFQNGVFMDRADESELHEWKKMHKYFLTKVYIDQDEKRIINRNPAYTARIPLIKEVWPEAKFIHICRDPYRVFKSMKNYFKKLFPALAMQNYEHINTERGILEVYSRMMDIYIEDSSHLQNDELVEIRFEELDEFPIEVMQTVYNRLGFDGFEKEKRYFNNYLLSLGNYRKNKYEKDDKDRQTVEKHWSKYIEYFGYARI